MTLKDLKLQIISRFVLAALFVYFAVNAVNTSGWGFIALFSVLFATNDIVSGTRMIQVYLKLKEKIDQKK